ncbi:MAG TPA: biotin/lipoyl-containing protein [Kofleriaceae bacterium]|nr:biotin/lipoyl-containing protein [Kofleriaceae bacterium]
MSGGGTTRLHAPALVANVGASDVGDHVAITSPAVGWWRPFVVAGEVVQPGEVIGELSVLGAVARVLAPSDTRGAVVAGFRTGTVAVDVGAALFVLDRALAANAGASETAGATAAATSGLAVCAPSSGRFYGRSGPGKPAFVSPGDVIKEGHTVCLLEVMKTFHRVTYGGAGLPPEARVVAVAVADEADVNSGDVLVRVEPA